jgi:7-carboxy-7-deazaguanine synthase
VHVKVPLSTHANLQPIEKPISRNGLLDVVEVFPTIQGEGPYAGHPAIFVRLAGCNLQCPACDTNYTTGRKLYDLRQICEMIDNAKQQSAPKARLVVITGGEPFRQATAQLLGHLLSVGFRVQYETNGTLFDESLRSILTDSAPTVSIVCSPKTPKISEELIPFITHYKYVLQEGHVSEDDGLPTSVLESGLSSARPPRWFEGRVYVQPMDEPDPIARRKNMNRTVMSALRYGYILSLQMHKILELP